MPVDRVGCPTVLLLDQAPLEPRPALPAVLAGVESAVEARVDCLSLHFGDDVVGQPAAAALGLVLERDQDLLGELERARP